MVIIDRVGGADFELRLGQGLYLQRGELLALGPVHGFEVVEVVYSGPQCGVRQKLVGGPCGPKTMRIYIEDWSCQCRVFSSRRKHCETITIVRSLFWRTLLRRLRRSFSRGFAVVRDTIHG